MARITDTDPLFETMGAADGFGGDPFGDFSGEGPLVSGETYEGEDQFLGRIVRRVAKVARGAAPLLRRLAPIAAKLVAGAVPGGAVLSALPGLLGEEPERHPDPFADPFDMEDPFDFEAMSDFEEEDGEEEAWEAEVPLGEEEGESGMLAETLLAEAARAVSDTEAAALAGGITITITGPAPISVRRVTPVLTRGTANIVRVLRRSPVTRPLVPVAGAIARSTTRVLAKRAASGQPVTPAVAARVMARQTAKTLQKPSRVAKAVVRNAVQRRRLSKAAVRRAEG